MGTRTMDSVKLATAVPASANRKLTHDPKSLPCAATYVSQTSCGPCPFKGGKGCYAESGHTGRTTRRLNAAAELASASATDCAVAEARAIAELPTDGRPLRLRVVGDSRTTTDAIITAAAVSEWQSSGGGPAWTYTHSWRRIPRTAWGTIGILASCETEGDVARAQSRGYAPARVVDVFEGNRDSRGIPCPQQTGQSASCAACRLCWTPDRLRRPILFAAHGATTRVQAALTALEGVE